MCVLVKRALYQRCSTSNPDNDMPLQRVLDFVLLCFVLSSWKSENQWPDVFSGGAELLTQLVTSVS